MVFRFLHCFILFLLLTLFCPQQGNCAPLPAPPLETVSIQLRWFHQFQFAGYYAAIEKGFYAEEGLNVLLKELDPKKGRIRPVVEGEAQYGISDASLLQARATGQPVVLLAQIFQHSPLVFLTLKESGIFSPYEMVGKKVMFDSDGVSLNAIFAQTLRNLDQIELLPHSYNLQDLVDKRVDVISAYLTNEPFVLRQQGVEFNLINPRSYGIDFYGDNLFTSEAELSNHPQRADKMVRATLKGWQYALQHQNEIIDLILSKYSPNADRDKLVYEAQMTEQMILPELVTLGEINPVRYERIAETYAHLGMVPGREIPEGFIYQQHKKPQIDITEEERAWLTKHPVIRVANEDSWPPFDFARNGLPVGLCVDLAKLVAQRLGIELEFVTSKDWNGLLEKAKQKEIDLFTGLSVTDERKDFLRFTEQYMASYDVIVVHSTDNSVTDIDDLVGRRMALVPGYSVTEEIRQNFPDITIVEAENLLDSLKLVAENKADAAFGTLGAVNYAIKTNLIPSLKIAGTTTLQGLRELTGLHMAVRKDWPMLQRLLQKGLNSVSDVELLSIQEKWLEVIESKPAEQIRLTAEEKTWLKANPVLRVAFDPFFSPVEFRDSGGQPQGISIDYLRRFEGLLGVRFEYPQYDSWRSTIDALKSGALDIGASLQENPERKEYFNFTPPYISMPIVIFSHDEITYVNDLQQLHGKRVAVIDGSAIHELFLEKHPEIELAPAPTIKKALTLLDKGKAIAYIGSLAVTSHYLSEGGLTQVKIVGHTPYQYDLAMAAGKHRPLLNSILTKALAAVPQNERNSILQKWFAVEYKHQFDYTLLWKTGIPTILIFGFIILWNRRLSQEITLRIKAEINLKVAKAEAEAAKDAAEAANRAKSTFLSNMSHELRTPLTAILGYSQLLQRNKLLPNELKGKVDTINRSGRHLRELINDVLEISRIESGHHELNPAPINLQSLLDDLEEMFLLQAEDKGLGLEFERNPALPVLLVIDQGKLRQILINLLGNASKFTQTGTVSVTAQSRQLNPTQIELTINVEDSGPGIAEEDLEKIFQPFEQSPSGKSSGGTGLGLAISRKFACLMGGNIKVESRLGKGSRFILTCHAELPPQTGKPELQITRQLIADPTELAGKCFLLADDEKATRKLLRQLFQPCGVKILEAENGKDAIALAEAEQPDLTFMDMRMPLVNGYEAIRRLKSSGRFKAPILAMSASALDEDRVKIMAAGADEFISKPVDIDEIMTIAGRLLNLTLTEQPLPVDTITEPRLSKEQLADLPTELCRELSAALKTLSPPLIEAAIDKIKGHSPQAADGLSRLAKEFRYDRISALLEEL